MWMKRRGKLYSSEWPLRNTWYDKLEAAYTDATAPCSGVLFRSRDTAVLGVVLRPWGNQQADCIEEHYASWADTQQADTQAGLLASSSKPRRPYTQSEANQPAAIKRQTETRGDTGGEVWEGKAELASTCVREREREILACVHRPTAGPLANLTLGSTISGSMYSTRLHTRSALSCPAGFLPASRRRRDVVSQSINHMANTRTKWRSQNNHS